MNQRLKQFLNIIVNNYATYDKSLKQYSLDVHDLPDYVQHQFAGLIISEDPYLASETTGIDNDSFENHMLPCLLKLLGDSTDKENQYDFIEKWTKGIASYHRKNMQNLIDEEIWNLNNERGFLVKPEMINTKRDAGREIRPY